MNHVEQQLQQAVRIHEAGDACRAEGLYRQILVGHSNYAAAWEHLGQSLADQQKFDEAIDCFRRVLTIDSRHASALNNLGNVWLKLGDRRQSLECYDQALAIRPDFVPVHINKAMALVQDGRMEEALKQYEQALFYDPHDPDIHKSVGIARLTLGDFAGGWPEYEWRYQAQEPKLPDLGPLWDGSALYGKTILLIAEPGLGDDIQFIRYAAWLKRRYKCRVLFGCRSRMRSLLSVCDGIDEFLDEAMPSHRLPHFDFFAPLMRVPAVLGHTLADVPTDVPYLTADPLLVEQWRQQLAAFPGRKIGIHWRVGHQQGMAYLRTIPLHYFSVLDEIPNVQLFSLQKGPGAEEIVSLPLVVDLGKHVDEHTGAFVETAAVLKNLDLLITCDTAIAHVAGALGLPVWVGLCNPADWRWGRTDATTVWYPSMRLFLQQTPGDWTVVMQQIKAALTDPRSPRFCA